MKLPKKSTIEFFNDSVMFFFLMAVLLIGLIFLVHGCQYLLEPEKTKPMFDQQSALL